MFEYQPQLKNPMHNHLSQLNSMQNAKQTGVAQIQDAEQMFDANRQVVITVVTADNGFVLTIRSPSVSFGAMPKTSVFVASSIEELRDLITSDLVSRRMGV